MTIPEIEESEPTPSRIIESPVIESSLIVQALRVAAYPLAIIPGVWVSLKELHSSVITKVKKIEGNPIFGPIKDKFHPQYAENAKARNAGIISQDEFFATNKKITAEHSEAMAEQMDKMGFGRWEKWTDLKSLSNKLSYVNKGVKHKIFLEGAAVTGIAVGVLLTICESKWLTQHFGSIDPKDDKGRK